MDHDPKYTISQIGAATGIEPNTIRTWFQRGHLKFLETDKRAEGNGLAHYLSMQSALYIAAVGALVAQGVSPKAAGEAAVSWVHIGSNDPFGMIAPRDPGELFDDGLTVLCVYSNGQAQVKHSPVIGGSILDLFQAYTGREDTATILILNFLDRRVRDAFARSASTN